MGVQKDIVSIGPPVCYKSSLGYNIFPAHKIKMLHLDFPN